MNNAEEFAKLAKSNEDMCAQEVMQSLQKYGCTLHTASSYVDGQLKQSQFFFKFEPDAFLNNQGQKKV